MRSARWRSPQIHFPPRVKTFLVDDGTVLDDVSFPDDKESWDAFTPKVTLSYKQSGFLAYVTYGEGYKSGQYSPASPADPGPVDPEKLTDIEAGIKASLLDNRVNVNVSIFDYDYKELQVFLVEQVGTGQLTSRLVNAAEAEIMVAISA
ncbi:MAG: TonB-dependent receptor [Steroidobacteraceae bacterium]